MVGSSNVCLDLLNCFRFESKVVGNGGGVGWVGYGLRATVYGGMSSKGRGGEGVVLVGEGKKKIA